MRISNELKQKIIKAQKGTKIGLFDSINPKNWGVYNYNNTSFDDAFNDARTDGEKEFMWKDKRYSTKLDGIIDHSKGKNNKWKNDINNKVKILNNNKDLVYQIYDTATSKHNLNDNQAIAVIANALMESELNPTRLQSNNSTHKAKGLFQFDPNGDLPNYIKKYKNDWNIDNQLEYVLGKFSNQSLKDMPIDQNYKTVVSAIINKNKSDKKTAEQGLGFGVIKDVNKKYINKNDTTGLHQDLKNIKFSKDNISKYATPKIWGISKDDI